MRRIWGAAPTCVALLVGPPAHAAGGAHVVDDAAVETPGGCNATAWVQHLAPANQDMAFALACTSLRLPQVEFGAGFGWTSGGEGGRFDPTLKIALHETSGGVAFAVAGTFALGLDSGRIDSARLIVPVTVPLDAGVQLNLNAGLVHVDGASLAAHFGAQLVAEIRPVLSLMGEAFVDTGGKPGAQAGLRLTPGKGQADFDLYVGHRIDGETDFSVGAGIVLRF